MLEEALTGSGSKSCYPYWPQGPVCGAAEEPCLRGGLEP